MSDDYLRFIPTDPDYSPPFVVDQRARQLLASFIPQLAEITINRYETIQFIDAGSNWGPIYCPGCGAILADEAWACLVDKASVTQFTNLSVLTPCCGISTSLNELRYGWPVGFARFVLSSRDPGADVSQQQHHLLESVLGCHLRKIWAHY